MTRFGSISQLLDDLAPAATGEEPAWGDVLARAELLAHAPSSNGLPEPAVAVAAGEERTLFARARRRPLVIALVVFVIALVPVSALAVAKNDPWWFLRFQSMAGEGPAKGSHVVVLETGTWNGQHWAFTAYRSVRGSLCTQFTLLSANGRPTSQGGGGCGATIGQTVRTANGHRRLTISYGDGSLGRLRYLEGPVVAIATTVRITLTDGAVITTPTFAAPTALRMPIRFFVTRIPAPAVSAPATTCKERVAGLVDARPKTLVGLDDTGKVVARLTVPGWPPGMRRSFCASHENHFVLPPNLPVTARTLKIVQRLAGPYGARATLAVGGVFPMRLGRFLPSGRLKHFSQQSRCWRVSFSNGQSQGTCMPVAKRYEPELSPQVQHAGRDTFVIAQTPPRTGPAIVRVTLTLANGDLLTAKPVDGVVLFAIPRAALSTAKSQRGFLAGYDKAGRRVTFDNSFGHVHHKRQAVYYRSCPPGTSCYG